METMYKRVASVTPVPLGDETTTAQVTTDTLILVANSGDFYEDGGHVRIDGEVYAYSAVEEGEDDDAPVPSITLDSGLVGNVAAGTTVEVWDPALSAVVTDWMVEVTDDLDGSSGTAYLDHALIPLLAEGLPPGVGDSVTVTVDDDGDWNVTNIHGKTPLLSLEYADPTTMPDPEDVDPPDESPTLFVVGLLETFLLRTDPVGPRIELTYQVSTNGGADWDDLPNMPVRTTVLEAKRVTVDDVFEVDVDYTFQVIASNSAGSAAPSAAVTTQLNTSAAAVIASEVVTGQIVAGFALLGQVSVGGANFTLSPPGVDSNNLPGGLRILFDNGGLIHLPADGETPAAFSGDVVAGALAVTDGMLLGGESVVHGTATLRDGGISDPIVPPTVTTSYTTIPAAATNPRGLCPSVAPANWVIVDGTGIKEFDSDGELVASKGTAASMYGITQIGSGYITVRPTFVTSTVLAQVRDSAFAVTDSFVLAGLTPGDICVGGDTTDLFICVDNNNGTQTVKQYDGTTGALLDADVITVTLDGPIAGVYAGTDNSNFAGDRIVLHPRNADAAVYDTGGVLQVGDSWPRPGDLPVAGFVGSDSGTGTETATLDNTGQIRFIENVGDQPGGTAYWSYAWVDSDTHHTAPSPEIAHVSPRRSKTRVTAPPAPQVADAGTHVANRVAIYSATSSGGTKGSDAAYTPPVGFRSVDVIFADIGALGAAPTTNNWAGIAPTGKFAAQTGGFEIDGESDGSVGTGTFRDSVDARVTAVGGATYQPLDSDLTAFAGKTAPSGAVVGTTDTQALTNKTLTAPVIRRTVNTQTGTTYTLALADEGCIVDISNAATHTLTVPLNATIALPIGAEIEVFRRGVGAVNVAAAGGVTIESRAAMLGISARYGVVSLRKRNTDIWVLSGDLV